MAARIFIIATLLAKSLCLPAQVIFCPPGANWSAMYTVSMFFPYATENDAIKYTHDSIIGADTVKVLKMHRFYSACSASYTVPITLIRQKGDTIFMKNNKTWNDWEILFNYAAQKGQSWTTTYKVQSTIYTYTITVDSVSIKVENSFPLRQLFVTASYSMGVPATLSSYTTVISERYGWGYLFFYNGNHYGCDGDFFIGTLCYSDSAFGTKYFSSYPCDYTNPSGLLNSTLKYYPEIFLPIHENEINIINGLPGSVLSVFDITGKRVRLIVLQNSNRNETVRLDIADLKPGLYFAMLRENTGQTFNKKILKTAD